MQPDPRGYEIRIWYSAEKGDECFIAQVVEWPGIMAHGETREEAARQIQLALEGALEVAAEKGIKTAGAGPGARLITGFCCNESLARKNLVRRLVTRHCRQAALRSFLRGPSSLLL